MNPRQAKVSRAHAAPQGTCDYLINFLKLLTNQQKDGDSSVENVVTGLLEKSRLAKFSRTSVPILRWRVLLTFGFSVCVPAVPLSEPDVTVPFCPVHGDCEVLCDSDCEIVEQQTLSLRKTRSVFWSEVKKT